MFFCVSEKINLNWLRHLFVSINKYVLICDQLRVYWKTPLSTPLSTPLHP